jgi:hypothetical protein
MKRRRLRLLSLVALGASGAAWAVPRRWLLPAALGAAWPAQAQPAEEDVAMMQKLRMDHGKVPHGPTT